MRFEPFAGNARAKEQAARLFDAGHLPHAILIDGPAGCGKRTFARVLAAAAVCEGTGERPCGVCRQCQNARAGRHPDITEQGGDGRTFPVDAVRALRTATAVGPNDAARKVFILANVQTMTEQAQNALLKLLEEPPAFALFLLTCDSRFRVLPTVRSRCVQFSLGPVTEEEAAAALRAADPALAEEDARAAARMAGGLIGPAREGLANGSFAAARGFLSQLAPALCGSAPYAFLRLSGALEADKALCAAVLARLPLLFRDALALREQGAASLSGCPDEARALAGAFTRPALFRFAEEAGAARGTLERYANRTLLLTGFFARLWRARTAPEDVSSAF